METKLIKDSEFLDKMIIKDFGFLNKIASFR